MKKSIRFLVGTCVMVAGCISSISSAEAPQREVPVAEQQAEQTQVLRLTDDETTTIMGSKHEFALLSTSALKFLSDSYEVFERNGYGEIKPLFGATLLGARLMSLQSLANLTQVVKRLFNSKEYNDRANEVMRNLVEAHVEELVDGKTVKSLFHVSLDFENSEEVSIGRAIKPCLPVCVKLRPKKRENIIGSLFVSDGICTDGPLITKQIHCADKCDEEGELQICCDARVKGELVVTSDLTVTGSVFINSFIEQSENLCVTGSLMTDSILPKTLQTVHIPAVATDFITCVNGVDGIQIESPDVGMNNSFVRIKELVVTTTLHVDAIECDIDDALVISCTINALEDVNVMGNLTVFGSFTNPSDQRVKQDVELLSDSEYLKKVCNLTPVSYKFIEDFCGVATDKQAEQIGLIAQDVELSIPQVVVTAKVNNHKNKQLDNFKAIDYTRMTVPLIGAVKALNAELLSLQALAQGMRDELDELKVEVAPAA